MRVGTICSGIGAPEKAVEEEGLDWDFEYCSEIDKFASAVHAQHWPDVPNLGDMTLIDGAAHPVEIIIGGTPCQAFSFAGGRKSLADARGNLTLAFVRLVHATGPLRYALWENVPGVLSVDDNAFGCFLGALVGADDPLEPGPRPAERKSNKRWVWRKPKHEDHPRHVAKWPSAGMAAGPLGRLAWRVLDAQYFGLAQRRERVFVVFCPAGSSGDPASVLFERQGLHRHPPTRGQSQQGPALSAGDGPSGDGGSGGLADPDGVAHTLRGEGFDASEDGTGRGTPLVPVPLGFGGDNRSGSVAVAATLTAKGNRQDFEVETFIAQPVVGAYRTTGNDGVYDTGDKVNTLTTSTDPNAQVLAFAMRGREDGNVPEVHEDGGVTTPALRAASGGSTNPHVATAYAPEVAPTLRSGSTSEASHGKVNGTDRAALVAPTLYAVRRLTPDECALLQGFKKGHSRIAWGKKPAEDCPDGPQYKTYGNSMAVAVIRWLGRRIDEDARRAA